MKRSKSIETSFIRASKKEIEEHDTVTTHNPIFKPRFELIEFLLAPDFEVISALCEAVLIPEDGYELAEALLDLFDAQGKVKRLLEWAITKEVQSSTTPLTLFRGANEATKFMAVLYNRLARTYLRELVGTLVKDITGSSSAFEVDPDKADKGIDVKDNMKKVLSLTSEFLQNTFDSLDSFPRVLRHVLYYIKNEVHEKYPASSPVIVGVFYFSRFIIPAIVSPHQYGLAMEAPSGETQRGLILISKLLQNLSNGIEFEVPRVDNGPHKTASFIDPLNDFIRANTTSLYQFYDKLTQQVDDLDNVKSIFNVSSEREEAALTSITNSMKKHQEKIYALLIKPSTKKGFIQVVEADLYKSIDSRNDDWLGNLKTPRKKKLEHLKYKMMEDRLDKLEKLEKILEDEVKSRKSLEKRLQELSDQLAEQRLLAQQQAKIIAQLQANHTSQ